MAWTNPNAPNQTDFDTFCYAQDVNGLPVTTGVLPANSDYLVYAFNWGVNNCLTACGMPAQDYILAVYNLGFHRLLTIAPDQPGASFFAGARKLYRLRDYVPGVVLASGDQGTSQTLVAPDWLQRIPLGTQDLLKTFWGREALGYLQMAGTYVVGIS